MILFLLRTLSLCDRSMRGEQEFCAVHAERSCEGATARLESRTGELNIEPELRPSPSPSARSSWRVKMSLQNPWILILWRAR